MSGFQGRGLMGPSEYAGDGGGGGGCGVGGLGGSSSEDSELEVSEVEPPSGVLPLWYFKLIN